jgi:exodeoxyribonuclease V alpha subunit
MKTLSPGGTVKARFAPSSTPRSIEDPVERDDDDFVPSYLAWEIARSARGASDAERAAVEALAAASVTMLEAGSTRMPLDRTRLAALLGGLGTGDRVDDALALLDRVRRGDAGPLSILFGKPGERKPLVIDGEWLSTEKMRTVEERFCVRVRAKVARTALVDDKTIRKSLQAVVAGPPALSDEQKAAVRAALSSGLALVTGGPGTGKTTIVVALLRALHWAGVPAESVAVAAPTGKAAHRLEQAIAAGLAAGPRDLAQIGLSEALPAPQTLHRLLGWSPAKGRFARHENDRLPHKVVVVDEASMIDLLLMDRLFRALGDDARLVLMGDADQLPSVEAGAVFRDLCAGLGAARLSKNLRVAADPSAHRIVSLAKVVNAGVADDRLRSVVVATSPEGLAFAGVEHVHGPFATVGDAFLDRWWDARIASPDFERTASRVYTEDSGSVREEDRADLGTLYDHLAGARILCATRVQGYPACADEINRRLLARLAAAGSVRITRRGAHVPGAPVLIQRNDYERRLFNGDQGVVVKVDRGRGEVPELMAAFARGQGFELWPVDDLPDLGVAFAMTVHKAQGSEVDHVALVLPDVDIPLLTRELIYTAVTRARRSVALVGGHELLARAVSRSVERHSGIADALLSH